MAVSRSCPRPRSGPFLDHLDDCQHVLPVKNASHAHFRFYGEDKFMAWCMEAYGVDRMPSMQVVESVPKNEVIQGLHLTVSCPAHRNPFSLQSGTWHPNCTRSRTASMHAFRTVKKWVQCFENTTAYELPVWRH